MRKIIVLFTLLALTGASAFAASANTQHQVQLNVPEIVLISLDSTALITGTVVAPLLAGNAPTASLDISSKGLWYTAVNSGTTHRNITVQFGSAQSAPAGTSLNVVASVSSPSFGVTAGSQVISTIAKNIVTGIPSCFTTRAVGAGASLTYTFSVDTPSSLQVGDNHTNDVIYTLTDGS